MSAPTSSATIEFPFSMIDGEIRKILEEEGVRFKPQIFGTGLELDSPAYDLDTEIKRMVSSALTIPRPAMGSFKTWRKAFIQRASPLTGKAAQIGMSRLNCGFSGPASRPLI